MHTSMMIEAIAKKDFDLDAFIELAIRNDEAREEIVKQMVENKNIMIYYRCYYVVSKASQECPELFYQYWNQIVGLMSHKNSYHRDFAIAIVGNLTAVDRANRFLDIKEDYFALVNDVKFMTGNFCIQNLLNIYRNKSQLREEIIALLLDIDNRCDYTEKQMGLLKCDILNLFDSVYAEIPKKDDVDQFIRNQISSISPKTRKKAKELVEKYGLIN